VASQGYMVVVAVYQGTTTVVIKLCKRDYQEYLSLKVYFSLKLLEVYWAHDFCLYKNFQSRKWASPDMWSNYYVYSDHF